MSSGGNSHQRAVAKAAADKSGKPIPAIPVLVETEVEIESSHLAIATYFVRTLGGASLLLGAAGDMVGVSFVIWAAAICIGLVLLIIDPWIEPSLRGRHYAWKLTPSVLFTAALVSFSYWVIFLPAPLDIKAIDFNGEHREKNLYGIEWKKEYSDLRVIFINHTGFSYRNLDLNISPEGLIVANFKQTTNLSGVQPFNTMNGPDDIMETTKDIRDGSKYYTAQEDLHLFAGTVRVLCDTLPKNSDFGLILAIQTIPPGIPVRGALKLPPGAVRVAAQTVRVYGSYESRGGNIHHIDKEIQVKLDEP